MLIHNFKVSVHHNKASLAAWRGSSHTGGNKGQRYAREFSSSSSFPLNFHPRNGTVNIQGEFSRLKLIISQFPGKS